MQGGLSNSWCFAKVEFNFSSLTCNLHIYKFPDLGKIE